MTARCMRISKYRFNKRRGKLKCSVTSDLFLLGRYFVLCYEYRVSSSEEGRTSEFMITVCDETI
jgi:hypothetical protein